MTIVGIAAAVERAVAPSKRQKCEFALYMMTALSENCRSKAKQGTRNTEVSAYELRKELECRMVMMLMEDAMLTYEM